MLKYGLSRTLQNLEAGEGAVRATHDDVQIKTIGWKKPQDGFLPPREIRRAKPQVHSCRLRLNFDITCRL